MDVTCVSYTPSPYIHILGLTIGDFRVTFLTIRIKIEMYKFALKYNMDILFVKKKIEVRKSYYVPTTLCVFAVVSFPPKILAMPKSDIFGFMSISSKTLAALRSLWIILSRESW